MKNPIRPRGLAVFSGLLIITLIFLFLLVDTLIERAIESVGTRIVGAAVELGEADLSLFPIGIRLDHLQITDPDSPMTNAVEVARIKFSLNGARLPLRKVIIEEMSLDGIKMGTPRKYSGAIVKKPATPSVSDKVKEKVISLPIFDMPDVQDILKKERLASIEKIETLRADIRSTEAKWQGRLKELPDEKNFKQYERRYKEIKKGKIGDIAGALAAAQEIKKIHGEISDDLKNMENVQREFSREISSLKTRLNGVEKAPLEDIRRIKNKYAVTREGTENIARMIFGPKISGFLQKAVTWYKKAAPFIERRMEKKKRKDIVKPMRGKGVDVRFKEYAPLPDFLIRTVNVGLVLKSGDISGKIRNITPDQDILGKPLDFVFSGKDLKGIRSVSIKGVLNHIVPGKNRDEAIVTTRGYRIRDMKVSESKNMPITIQEGKADLDVNVLLTGDVIKGRLTVNARPVRMAVGKEAGDAAARAVQSSLSQVGKFSLRADITGTVDDYEITVSSDLDEILSAALRRLVRERTMEFERKLEAALTEKMRGPLKDLRGSFGGIDTLRNEIASRLNVGENLLRDIGKERPGGVKLPF